MTLVQANRGDFSDGTTDGKMTFDLYGGKGNYRGEQYKCGLARFTLEGIIQTNHQGQGLGYAQSPP